MELLEPGTSAYDEARRVFNVAREGRPAAIARCAGAADVAEAVRHARREGLSVAVRAGGHSILGAGSATGALVVDVRGLSEIRVDGGLSVGGGVLWGDVHARLGPLGQVIPGGFDPRVGVAGLTLGGGYGLLSRLHGLAADNLDGAEIVLASGERMEADAELLWALRGAGACFGVVTRLDLRLHARAPLVSGTLEYPLDLAPEVLRAARDLAAGFPDEASLYMGIDTRDGGLVVLQAFHVGAHEGARRWLGPLGRLAGARRTDFREASALAVPDLDIFPEGHHHAWGADFVRALDDGVLEAVIEHCRAWRGERVWLVLEHLGGAIGRVAADATAFPHRAAGFGVVSTVRWDGAPPTSALATQRALHLALAPWSIGRYVNYAGADEAEAAYGANLPRLRQLKAKWDPDDLFRHNVRLVP